MKKLKLGKLFALVFLFSFSSHSWSLPIAAVDNLNFFPTSMDKSLFANYDFEGIVRLSNCSGSLVKFAGQPATDFALVMTNGHCLEGGFLKPGQVAVNKPSTRTFKLYKKYDATNPELISIQAQKIVYSTMTDTDVTLYQLNETYQQILDRSQIRALTINKSAPVVGTEMEIISGYWNRGYSCAVDGFVFRLREADWTWKNSIRYTDGCATIGGTSGSPIIEKGTRTVIGINNTGNENGEKCTMNNPCEVTAAGEVLWEKELRYGQNVYLFYSCLDEKFQLDLKKEGCQLPK
jgi:V8-like Glu-specific endopeptidase